MSRLFKRGASLTLQNVRKVNGVFPLSPDFNATETVTITDLRIAFTIEKHLGSEPNRSTIIIYNLGQQTRGLLQRKPLLVQLDAGYDGNLKRLFRGDAIWTSSMHEGVDWASTLLLGDGERAVRHARISKSYRAGTNAANPLQDIVSALGGTLAESARNIASGQLVNGITMHGKASRELSRFLKPLRKSWSIQNGKIQILDRRGVATREEIEVSQDTGMVGSPEYGTPSKPGERPTLSIRTLLHPEIEAGGLIRVKSRSINGLFRVERIEHSGDTHGEDWTSNIEAKEYHA